jgi:UDP:flavonoid glycosyltransferase YjiC (YdhE family)
MGLPGGGNPIFDTKHSPLGTLVMFPEFLGAPQPDWPRRFFQCGFPFYGQGQASPALAEFLDAGGAPLVFTLGSIVAHFEPRFYHAAVEAAQRLGMRAVLLTGRNAGVPGELPAGIFAAPYEPLGALLPRAAAVVHAGGIGTCAEALRAGVPSVVVPFAFDQPDNAWRLRKLGVAAVVPRNSISAKSLAVALGRVAGNAAVRKNASRIAGGIDAAAGVGKAVDAIEAAAAGVLKKPRPSGSR